MKISFLFGLLLFALPAWSQILNVEKSRLHRDTANYWVGEVHFNLLLHNRSATTDTPVRYTGIGTGADLAYVSKMHRYVLINQLDYSAITGNPFISTGYSHFRTTFLWRKKISYEGFSQYQYDFGRGLQNRFLIGGGIRYSFVEEEDLKVTLGVGAMYEHERWEVPDTEEEIFIATNFLKSTNYLSARWTVNEFVNLNSIFYYQTGYDRDLGGFRNRFSMDSNLNMKLTKRLTFFATFKGAYDSQPIVPIVNFVYSLNNGIKLAF